mmetsp:Transcript_50663/g.134984  ORF Transcript_50663/g.134984 Transcript_50663/m.134984 type:complete len:208 (-) Transcript_50663:54-677(-)
MAVPRVRLLGGDVGSGKTSVLLRLSKALQDSGFMVSGVLCPQLRPHGRRRMVLLSSGAELPLQINDGAPCPGGPRGGDVSKAVRDEADAHHGLQVVAVGPFIFDASAFLAAEAELESVPLERESWVFVDEVGPLELKRHEGLHRAVDALLQRRRNTPLMRVCIVVRPACWQLFLKEYGLAEDDVEVVSIESLAEEAAVFEATGRAAQ